MKLHQDCAECDDCEAKAIDYLAEHPDAERVTWGKNAVEGEPKHSAKVGS